MTQTTRRALLAAAAFVPAFMTAAPATAINIVAADPRWTALVADYHTKRATWVESIGYEDDAADDLEAGYATLPPKPQEPVSVTPNISDLTISQINALTRSPEHIAVWGAYERELGDWTTARDAVRQSILAPGKARYDAAYKAYAAAFDAVTTHRVSSPAQMAEKIEIIALDYEGSEIPQEYLADVLADARHLAGRAA